MKAIKSWHAISGGNEKYNWPSNKKREIPGYRSSIDELPVRRPGLFRDRDRRLAVVYTGWDRNTRVSLGRETSVAGEPAGVGRRRPVTPRLFSLRAARLRGWQPVTTAFSLDFLIGNQVDSVQRHFLEVGRRSRPPMSNPARLSLEMPARKGTPSCLSKITFNIPWIPLFPSSRSSCPIREHR